MHMLSRWDLPVDNFADQVDELVRDIARELGEPKAFQIKLQLSKKNPHQAGKLLKKVRLYLNSAPQKLASASSIDKL